MHSKSTGFADIKLSGGRYEAAGFPLVGLPELERFERLVLEVAKHVWRARHPDRLRLPPGFAEGLGLRLIEIRSGSTIPVLERSQETLSFADDTGDVFDEARALTEAAFEAIVRRNWSDVDLPSSALPILRKFGTTFRGREAVTFRATTPNPVRYDAAARRAFLTQSESEPAVRVQRFTLGVIKELDLETCSFKILSASDGLLVPGKFSEKAVVEDLKGALQLDEERFFRVEGTFLVDSTDRILEIVDVTDVEEFLSTGDAWASALLDLAKLQRGWLDGAGEPIDLSALELARDILDGISRTGSELPRVFPTEEGGIQFEWHGADTQTEIEITPDLILECGQYGPGVSREESVRGVARALEFLAGSA